MDRSETADRPSNPPPRRRDDGAARSTTSTTARLRVLPVAEATRDAGVRAVWDRRFAACDHPNAFHASRAWAEYLAARGGAVHVAILRQGGAVTGVVPLMCHAHGLDYEVGTQRVLRSRLRVADVLGSVPLVPSGAITPAALVQGVLDGLPDCDAVFLESLPVESAYAGLEYASDVLAYRPLVARADRLVKLEGTFAEYSRGRSAKLRFNVERSLRTLRGVGSVGLCRYDTPADVDRLFTDASHVRRRSWQRDALGTLNDDPVQSSHEALSELARRDLLRSYVLYAGEVPCAFVIGYQHQGVYFYGVVGYDAAFSRHSPGSALLHLMMEDLYATNRPRTVSFGRGDDDYKRRFGTTHRYVGTWFFLRPTLLNRVRVRNHRLFSQAKGLLVWGT
ncbi:MAG TPA: GNAT family N-acetyltransferase [Polyangiaceae bacterium]|jgi:CelD/BcsL family acetyltransferase involved in cellulose biosynthesis|nr:GNAT family N-acetyltransferase [Polyangiaceae bacterium]